MSIESAIEESKKYTTSKDFKNGNRPAYDILKANNLTKGLTWLHPRVKTLGQFLERARRVHGNKYNYEDVVYTKNYTKVKIICPEHGAFLQAPSQHMNGCGCPECGKITTANKARIGFEEFLLRARGVHGWKFDYTRAKETYSGYYEKVCIVCPEHGEFWQTPERHVKTRYACPKCVENAKKAKPNTEAGEERKVKFITAASEIHNNKYDYSKTNYTNCVTRTCITCPEHGDFWITPLAHLRGNGCPTCGQEHRKDLFVLKANEVHNNKYDYSKAKYINTYTAIEILCPEHGPFLQKPESHLMGCGCPKCAGQTKAKKVNEKHYKIARQYSRLQDYKNEHPSMYCLDVERGLIDSYTWMDKTLIDYWGRDNSDSRIRCIYVYEFPETKTAYVGLTKNKKRRHQEHMQPKYDRHTGRRIHNPVYDYMESSGLNPTLKYLEDSLTKKEAQIFESKYSSQYEEEGWTLLNRAPCGSLGGHKAVKELTPEEIIEEAHKYRTPKELRKANPYAEKKMWQYGISRECFPNIKHRRKKEKRQAKIRRYTEKLLSELCEKYTNTDFQDVRIYDPALYNYLRNHNLIYKYFPNYRPGMRVKKRTPKYMNFTKEKFIDILQSKYDSRADLRKRNGDLFRWAKENKGEWLDECFPPKETTPYQNRTKSDFEVICTKFKNRTELRNKNECLYIFLRDHRKEWLDEFLPSKNNRNF